MPIHDWTCVDAGIFHAFHHEWVSEISRALNRGLLPADHYALPEQIAGGFGPDVVTLQRPYGGDSRPHDSRAAIAVRVTPPQVKYRLTSETDRYAAKAKAVVIRHASNHNVIAIVEIVSPGNKNSRHGLRSFVAKAVELLRGGIHLLVLDLFPPTSRDPQGIHKAIWDEFNDTDFVLPPGQPLTLASYRADQFPEAFIEPTAVGQALIEMPIFLSADDYVPVPLEATYGSAWEAMPEYWRQALVAGSKS